MYKLFVLSAALATVAAAPGHLLGHSVAVQAAPLTHVSSSSGISHQSRHDAIIPVHETPVVHSVPAPVVAHAVPAAISHQSRHDVIHPVSQIVRTAPVIQTAHVVQTAPAVAVHHSSESNAIAHQTVQTAHAQIIGTAHNGVSYQSSQDIVHPQVIQGVVTQQSRLDVIHPEVQVAHAAPVVTVHQAPISNTITHHHAAPLTVAHHGHY